MVQIGFKCNKGVVREKNEDSCFVIPSQDVYILADGVGGNNAGEVASRIAVSEIASYVNENDIESCSEPDDIFGFLYDAVEIANEKIYDMSVASSTNRGMATTVVISYIRDGSAYIVNLGDSRAYLFRDGTLNRITKDHSYVNELIEKGAITEEEAETHRQKNIITKALGAENSANPDFYKLEVAKDDIIMMCSDGLYGDVDADSLADILGGDDNMNDTCAKLVDQAIKCGGRDNITVICLKIQSI